MANSSSPSISPSAGPIPKGPEHGAEINLNGLRSCSIRASWRWPDAAYNCPSPSPQPIAGLATYAFTLQGGRKVKGADLIKGDQWPWRQSLDAPGCRYARLRAKSATYGEVTLILVDKAGEDRFYLFCLASDIPATRLLRVWSRRNLIEQVFRTLKHLLATDACQVHSEDAYYGHLVLRLMASFVLYYTSRVLFKGRVTMDEMIFNLKHHWSSVDCQELELYGLS